MLTDTAGRSIRRELIEFIKDLDEDEAAAVVALSWIGRGDFQPEEWKIAVAQAKERAEGPTWKYLLEMELPPDYPEDALSAFGRSCEGLGSRTRGEPGRRVQPAGRRRRSVQARRPYGCRPVGQVSPIACQLGPGLGLTGPPPAIVFPFMSQIEALPLLVS